MVVVTYSKKLLILHLQAGFMYSKFTITNKKEMKG